MSTLGNTSTAAGPFTISSTFGDVAGGRYTVPNPGILVNDIKVNLANNGTSGSGRLYIWQDSSNLPGTWLIRGTNTFTLPGSQTTHTESNLTDNTGITNHFIAGGTKIWIGYYAATGTSEFWANSGSGGGTELGNTADGNWNDHGPASFGQIAAWIDYTLAGVARINTGTLGTPVWTAASGVYINTGTLLAPVWTIASNVAINTGTLLAPVWTPAT